LIEQISYNDLTDAFLQCLYDAKEKMYNNVLILEDDFIFSDEITEKETIEKINHSYERMISDLFYFKLININTSKEDTQKTIEEYMNSESNYDNHKLPQYVFITDENNCLIPNIHILRTETLTNDMIQLGYSDFNIHDNKNENKINCFDYLNEKSIGIINEYYHEDFVLFGYEKCIF
jgi:hypothetical protein